MEILIDNSFYRILQLIPYFDVLDEDFLRYINIILTENLPTIIDLDDTFSQYMFFTKNIPLILISRERELIYTSENLIIRNIISNELYVNIKLC